MSPTEAPALPGPGGDPTKGRFEWFSASCGTIYADTEDDAIACAYHRILPSDPGHAAREAVNVTRVGYNAAHGTDWVAPNQPVTLAQANPALLDIAVPGAVAVPQAPPYTPPGTAPVTAPAAGEPQAMPGDAVAPYVAPGVNVAPTEPPPGAPGLDAPLPDFSQGA